MRNRGIPLWIKHGALSPAGAGEQRGAEHQSRGATAAAGGAGARQREASRAPGWMMGCSPEMAREITAKQVIP